MQNKTHTKTSTARSVPVTAAVPANTAPVAAAKVATATSVPSHEQIASRAYEIYVARGQTSGHEMEDWIQAERELSARPHRNN